MARRQGYSSGSPTTPAAPAPAGPAEETAEDSSRWTIYVTIALSGAGALAAEVVWTRLMGMLVRKHNLGFGDRSWRYSMYVEDGVIKKMFIEKGFSDDCADDPFEVSDADTMLAYLREIQK